ncbi:MAG: ATP-binding protein [Fimbriimonadaceae bacterium]|nr:ATP-binding protein [Chitinophagales bacterium]
MYFKPIKKVRAKLRAGEKVSDMDWADITGPVKHAMLTTYRAHQKSGELIQGKIEIDSHSGEMNYVLTFNEKGIKVRQQYFSDNSAHDDTFNERGLQIKGIHYMRGELYQTSEHSYNDKDQILESNITDKEGKPDHRHIYTYNAQGKHEDTLYFRKEEQFPYQKTTFIYDENGNMLSNTEYDGEGNIRHESLMEYDERNLRIAHSTKYYYDPMQKYNKLEKYKYNVQGDCIQYDTYDEEGNLIKSSSYKYEYDSTGKRINNNKWIDADDEVAGETIEVEEDAHGNWIKKTKWYNKIPVNIQFREFIYYGENDERELIHPISLMENVEEETENRSNAFGELKKKEAKWMVTEPGRTPENFPYLRYYSNRFNEVPSVVQFNGPHIEAITLLQELKENMGAEVIHSYSTVYNSNAERIQRYTLLFGGAYGYMLHTTNIYAQDENRFEVPDNIEDSQDGHVYLGTFQLLRPSEASGKCDWYFEEELKTYIEKCSLSKKPDKPVINIIEVQNNSFTLSEYPVHDNFIIRDLDVNYGYGFEKFHLELMQRFASGTKGLVLFHGQPGTGKTYYIRHLLRKMAAGKKTVIYMPPNMVDHLVDPVFMTFLTEEMKHFSEQGQFCVLLIEDAEPLLAKRQEGVRIQGVTNLLNMSDGILNDMLNLQIICTFNVDLRKLDSALLRPGRLIARKEFKPLSELDANLLGQRLGIKHHFIGPATLGEIYARIKNNNTLIHDVEPDRDASTIIDDLL